MLNSTKYDNAINLNTIGQKDRMGGDVKRSRRLSLLKPLLNGNHPSDVLTPGPQHARCSGVGCCNSSSASDPMQQRTSVVSTPLMPLTSERWASIWATLILERAAQN